jgi:hypothetical protein
VSNHTNRTATQPFEEKARRSQLPIAFLAGLAIVLLLAAAIVLLSRSYVAGPPAAPPMPFGPQEQAYSTRIQINNLHLSRSSNLLNQQFTYVSGTLLNNGDRTISGLTMTVDFRDSDNKVVLHDSEPVLGPTDPPIAGGQSQDFTMTIEQFPETWNQEMPSVRITGLVLR